MAASSKKESKVKEQESKKPASRGCCRKAASAADKKANVETKEVKTTAAKSCSKTKSCASKATKATTAEKAAPKAKSTATKATASKSVKAETKTAAKTVKATASKTAKTAEKTTKATAAKTAKAETKTVKAAAKSKTAASKATKAKSEETKTTKAASKTAATKTTASKAKATKTAEPKTTASKAKTSKAAEPKKTATTAKKTAAAAKSKAATEDKVVVKASMADAKKISRKMLAPVDSKREIVRKAEPSKGVEPEFADITLLNKKERFEVMRLLEEQNPNPKSELNFSNPFELLCAVVLSAQATDESVNKATPELFKAAPDAKSMAALGADGIAPYIQSIGLWKNKAKFLEKLSRELDEKYGGKVPETMEELIALPGVGSKTAKVVLNVAFGQPFLAVDTHVFRVCGRIGLCLGHCPGDVENKIPPLIDERFMKEAHHYLLLHGRYNCTARKFEDHCAKCVVAKYCKHNY